MSFSKIEKNVELKADKSTKIKKEPNKKEIHSPSNFEINEKSFSSNASEKELKNKEEFKFFDVSEYYIRTISEDLISKYGRFFLKSFDQKNLQRPPKDFISKHKINPLIRTKMVNWMIEVFHSFNSNEETIFSSVTIMDKYLWKSKDEIKSEDIHLIGMVCMYLASKTYDMTPIQMNVLIKLVGHDLFDQITIKEMEKKIIKTINFDVFTPTTYEFIQFLLYDFYINNKQSIVNLKIKKMLDILENCSIWLAKMCNHFEYYSSVSPIYLSFSCVIIAFDLMKNNCKSLNEDMQKFFKLWLKFLFNNIAKTPDIKIEIEKLCERIEKKYREFSKMNLKNLSKYHVLFFE